MEKTELAFIAQEQTALIANLTDGNDDPVNYNQVKYNPDIKKWWKAMCTEFENIEKKNVWQIVEKSKVPANRQVIGNRWVFVNNDDGRFQARTVAKGFNQIPGKIFKKIMPQWSMTQLFI